MIDQVRSFSPSWQSTMDSKDSFPRITTTSFTTHSSRMVMGSHRDNRQIRTLHSMGQVKRRLEAIALVRDLGGPALLVTPMVKSRQCLNRLTGMQLLTWRRLLMVVDRREDMAEEEELVQGLLGAILCCKSKRLHRYMELR
jgi:hypothetical protein